MTDWQQRVNTIWDILSNPDQPPINWDELNKTIHVLENDLKENSFVDLPSNRKPFLALFCGHLIPLTTLMINGNGLIKNESELEIIQELYNKANVAYAMLKC